MVRRHSRGTVSFIRLPWSDSGPLRSGARSLRLQVCLGWPSPSDKARPRATRRRPMRLGRRLPRSGAMNSTAYMRGDRDPGRMAPGGRKPKRRLTGLPDEKWTRDRPDDAGVGESGPRDGRGPAEVPRAIRGLTRPGRGRRLSAMESRRPSGPGSVLLPCVTTLGRESCDPRETERLPLCRGIVLVVGSFSTRTMCAFKQRGQAPIALSSGTTCLSHRVVDQISPLASDLRAVAAGPDRPDRSEPLCC